MALSPHPDPHETEFEDLMFDEQPQGQDIDSEASDEDDAAAPAFSDSEELELDEKGIAIIGATSESEKSSTLRASLEDRSLPAASPPMAIAQPMRRPDHSFLHISASMPARTSTAKLGSSAPIAIPNMARWRPGGGYAAGEANGAKEMASTFIPPHQLSRQDDFQFSFVGASPAGALKRERLRTRNAILRSTGFLEPHAGARQSLEENRQGAAPAVAVLPPLPRPVPSQSTLTAALTTIGEV